MFKSTILLDKVVALRPNVRVYVKSQTPYVGDVVEVFDDGMASVKSGESIQEHSLEELFIPYVSIGYRKYYLSLEWRNHLKVEDIGREVSFVIGDGNTNKDKAVRIKAYLMYFHQGNYEIFYSFTTDFTMARDLIPEGSKILQWQVL
jgi:signal peptidase I